MFTAQQHNSTTAQQHNSTTAQQHNSTTIDSTSGYPLIKLEKNQQDQYIFPNTPCGILPFFINSENKIVWGCIETNRVGISSTQPPAGTQDIIIIKDEERFSIEASKPFPDLQKDFLKPYVGKNFSGQNYQDILSCLSTNGYEIYLENMLATAAHETYEENGTDLRINGGKNLNSLIEMYDIPPQAVKAKRGMTTQKIYAAHLSSDSNVELKYTDKIEEKIVINKGRSFYEKGIWCELESLKLSFNTQKINFAQSEKSNLTDDQIKLIESEFVAWESRIELMEKVEVSIISSLENLHINSIAQAEKIDFTKMETPKFEKSNSHWTTLSLLSPNNNVETNTYDNNLKSLKY